MSIFGKIKDAIFGHKAAQQQPQAAAPAQPAPATPQAQPAPAAPAQPEQVDVEDVLRQIAFEKNYPNLNWESSIVDLMKLLDLDSSLSNREALAQELGYTGERNGSAEMNIWLYQAVMKELEKNGGKVSAALQH